MLTVRRGLSAALFAGATFALASQAAAVPITVTQTATADPVLPYLTFTNVTLTPGGRAKFRYTATLSMSVAGRNPPDWWDQSDA
jgi:hypothetical protein